MELKLGKMTSKEIAEWMDISYGTYQRNTKKRLEKLKYFADFEPCYGGVIIKEIYIPEYIKNFNDDDKIYLEEVKATGNGLSSLSGMTRKLKVFNKEFEDISDRTLYNRMKNAGIRTFGVTADEHSSGSYGRREYLWAIKVDDLNHYREMTMEENKIYEELKHKFCATDEVANKIEKLALLKDAYKDGEITIDQIQEELTKDFFEDVLQQFLSRTGHRLVRATWHQIYGFPDPKKIEKDE